MSTLNFNKLYSSSFEEKISNCIKTTKNPIVVIIGVIPYLDFGELSNYVLDKETFRSNLGEDVFSKSWFKHVFNNISDVSPVIFSYSQYSYIVSYIDPSFFKDRVFIFRDNLRSFFPISSDEFISDTQKEDDSSINLPLYQADQFVIEGEYYCSFKNPDFSTGRVVDVFDSCKELPTSSSIPDDAVFIDPFSNESYYDVLLDKLIDGRLSTKHLCVKFNAKQPKLPYQLEMLKQLNGFLSNCGISLAYVRGDIGKADFEPSKDLLDLLRRYWGSTAAFRKLKIYENPELNNHVTEISQGQIVQTLIDEYENTRAKREYRDLFLTAPTGAGKSLLFQLPAFYISGKGDVSIVVSPLIALMKDQVKAIQNDRNFSKVAYLNSEISLIDREAIIEQCKKGELDVLYMAPELLLSYDIRYFIGDRKIGLMIIDEAHLVTTWGRDFRVDYWYVGAHINKIRKYSDQEFPIIAVTATAVYGGDKNDMVFDTVDSLYLHNPHYYIGVVKRDNIEFLIGNYSSTAKDFDRAKINQTVDFIKVVKEKNFKTLLYAPYKEHVNKIVLKANENEKIAVSYHGNLDPLSKEQSELAFRSNQYRIMVCTKAFGMGVDIPDIQVVYHHAPSGLLPDYIQEIGRVARTPGMQGYAVLNYSPRDQRYSKQLYGMSSIRVYHLRAVLKKVYEKFINGGNKRNMLISVDDFSYAFSDFKANDVANKVKTALMMIEKDYLAKYRYNVLIARPKALFTKVFAKLSPSDFVRFESKYSSDFTVMTRRENGDVILKIDLEPIWSKYFSDKGFPLLKRSYFEGNLFKDVVVSPVLRFSATISDFRKLYSTLESVFKTLKAFFVIRQNYFVKEDLVNYLESYLENLDKSIAKPLASFLLSAYSDYSDQTLDAFLHRRGTPSEYRVSSGKYQENFSQLLRITKKLFSEGKSTVTRYLSKENSLPYVRLSAFIEILNLGSYEMSGGEAPMIFVRVNNPFIIKKDFTNKNYKNILLEGIKDKHTVSSEIFDYFFTHNLSNEDRWNFIEDFFLGENNEELMQNYPGIDLPNTNVLKILSDKDALVVETGNISGTANSLLYPPRTGCTYHQKDHLSLEVEGRMVTRTIGEWISEDPIPLHKCVYKKVLYVDPGNVYKPLMASLRVKEPSYYDRIIGTMKKITMPGYREPTEARSIMADDPIRFYKWWNKDRDAVYLTKQEQIELFLRVEEKESKVLLKKDKKVVESGRI